MRDVLISVALGALVPLAVACVLFMLDIGKPPVSVPMPSAPVRDR